MLKGIASITTLHLYKRLKDLRIWIFLLMLIIFLDCSVGGIRQMLAEFDESIPFAAIFPLLTSDARIHCPLLILFALLLCDLPGWDNSEPYVLLRSGRSVWIRGKMLCVVVLSLLYWLVVIAVSALIIGRLSFENDWGNVMRTLSETSASDYYDISLFVSAKVMILYSPAEAFFFSVVLNVLLSIFGGMWALIINYTVNRPIGASLIAAFALLDRAIGGLLVSEGFYKISPVSMASLQVIDEGYWPHRPTLSYSLTFYLVGIIGAIIVMEVVSKRVSIKTTMST